MHVFGATADFMRERNNDSAPTWLNDPIRAFESMGIALKSVWLQNKSGSHAGEATGKRIHSSI